MTAIAIAVLVLGLLVVVRWRTGAPPHLVHHRGPRVCDAMRTEALRTVSAEATAEEVLNVRLGPAVHDLYAVLDHDGHAVGTVRREDLVRLPHRERPARLVGEVMRGGVLRISDDLGRALAEAELSEADRVVVVDDRRLPVGTLALGDARAAAATLQPPEHAREAQAGA